jgi:hypothetical protein
MEIQSVVHGFLPITSLCGRYTLVFDEKEEEQKTESI